jgi:predicted flap endonuclease-1-like 5' DNA nuclease
MHRNKLSRVALVAALATVFLAAGGRPAQAGQYELADVPELMDDAVRARVAAAGIQTTAQLLEATRTKAGRAKLGKETGQAADIVQWWANFTDLLRVNGIGPKMAKLIQMAGVANIAGLKKETAAGLLAKVTAANTKYRVTELLPQEHNLSDWIGQAQKLPVVVE